MSMPQKIKQLLKPLVKRQVLKQSPQQYQKHLYQQKIKQLTGKIDGMLSDGAGDVAQYLATLLPKASQIRTVKNRIMAQRVYQDRATDLRAWINKNRRNMRLFVQDPAVMTQIQMIDILQQDIPGQVQKLLGYSKYFGAQQVKFLKQVKQSWYDMKEVIDRTKQFVGLQKAGKYDLNQVELTEVIGQDRDVRRHWNELVKGFQLPKEIDYITKKGSGIIDDIQIQIQQQDDRRQQEQQKRQRQAVYKLFYGKDGVFAKSSVHVFPQGIKKHYRDPNDLQRLVQRIIQGSQSTLWQIIADFVYEDQNFRQDIVGQRVWDDRSVPTQMKQDVMNQVLKRL